MKEKTQKIGLIVATSLVVGNTIGVGIFLLPATLASYGSISILGWVFTAAGAIIMAKIFSNFSKIIVNKSGGPYTYTRVGFGDFTGFLVAWGYWISCWVSNGAVAIAIVGALSFFVPSLNTSPLQSISVGLGLIWLFTWINSRGIKQSGRIQVVTTVLKIVPLIFVIFLGIFFFDVSNFPDFNLTGESTLVTLPAVATLTFYAFLGIESATIPAGNIKNAKVTVPRATIYGTILTIFIYILSTIVLFGIIPFDILKDSAAPFAEAGELIGGKNFGYFIAAGAAISGIGALNGWILITGQVPMAAAKDNLFPRIFKRENKSGSPIIGLIIGGLLSSTVMLLNYSEGLVKQFEMIVQLTVLTALVPYLFTTASYVLVLIDKKLQAKNKFHSIVLPILGFAFTLGAIYGSGEPTVFYGFLLLLLGVPFYIIGKWVTNK